MQGSLVRQPLIRRNLFYSFLSSSVRLLTNMLLFVGIARYYGAEAFGQFTIAHTYLTLFFLVADFGFDLLLTTEVAHDRSHAAKNVGLFLPMKTVFSLGASTLMLVVAVFSGFSSMTKMLMVILSSGILANALSSCCFAVFKGCENLFEEARVSFIQNVVLLLLLIILGIASAPLILVALVFVLSRVVGVLLILSRTFKLVQLQKIDWRFPEWRETVKRGFPFGVHLLFGTLYFQLDTILLAYWKGDEAVGVYQAAMKLLVLVLLIPDVISNVTLPLLSRLQSESLEKWNHAGQVLVKTLMYISLPFAFTFFVYPEQIITLVYGSQAFAGAVPLLRVFAFTIIVRYSADTYAVALTTSKNQTVRMYIVIGMTMFNLLLNIFAIPRFGIEGAAAVSLITNTVASVLYVVAAHIKSFQFLYLFSGRQITVIGVSLALGLAFMVLRIQSMYIGVPLVLLCYTVLYYFVGYTPDEWALVFDLPKRFSA